VKSEEAVLLTGARLLRFVGARNSSDMSDYGYA